MPSKRTLIAIAIAGVLGTTSALVLARGGPGGNAGGQAGGMSAGHMSSQGLQNTNGPNASDRDKGLDRAEDRMSEEGLEHSKAREAALKRQAAAKAKAAAQAKAREGSER